MFATVGPLTVNMDNNTFRGNFGLFISLSDVTTLNCGASSFVDTSTPGGTAAISGATVGIFDLGIVRNSDLGGSFFAEASGGSVHVISARGDFLDNSGAALFSGDAVTFSASEELTFSRTTGSIVSASQVVQFETGTSSPGMLSFLPFTHLPVSSSLL